MALRESQWSFYPQAASKRSAERMANWFMASFQSLAARPRSAMMLRKASQISSLAAASPGKWPRLLMILRRRSRMLSMALVV
jgi:hypothetical protein